MHTLSQHRPKTFVFGGGTAPTRFAGLGIRIVLCFGNNIKANGNRLTGVLVQRRNKVDPLNIPVLAVIPVPTDNVVFIGIRLLLNRVIKDEYAFGRLNLTYQGFNFDSSVKTPDWPN